MQCSMRWKWLPANYSSWIFVRSTDDHRSLQVNPPRPMYGNHRPQEICREIRHRNPSENLSRNLISVPLSSEIGEIDWLKRTAISRVLVNWCNPQMFGGVHQVRHFCKRLEGNFAVSKISNFLLKVLHLLVGLNKRVEVQPSLRWQMIWNIWILEKQ